MAKLIQISNDAEVTWDDLPGSSGEFASEGESIDDTILGQSFQSQETGLIGWSVNSDGIFKGFAGYVATISKQGTGTTAAGEAMTQEAGQIYAIDDGTKDIWDRSVLPVIDDNAVDHTADVEWIDYLFGRVKFLDAYSITEPVTADIDYFPKVALGKANTYNLTMTAAAIDLSDFATVQANGGFRTFKPGLRQVQLELGGIFDATASFKAELSARNELIIEVDPAGDGSSICRGFYKLATTTQSGDVGALEEETLNFTLNVPSLDTPYSIDLPFNWRHTATTLSESIQSAITSWITELNTYDVRYMPEGAIGQSPLDAIKGNVVFTDISLSGGLSNMNVFEIQMQGTGVYTVV